MSASVWSSGRVAEMMGLIASCSLKLRELVPADTRMGLLQDAEDCLLKRNVSPESWSHEDYSRPLLAIACGVDPKSGLAAHLDVYTIGVT